MDDDFSQWGAYTQTMSFTTPVPDPVLVDTPSRRSGKKTDTRKCAKWYPHEHHIFIRVAEHVTVEGHRRGKCFSTTGWERIRDLFNRQAGKDWTIAQLKNHWGVMRTDHKLLFELLRSTGIQYDLSNVGIIEALDWWWEQKLKENPKYGKFKDNDNREIYHTYSKLFGGSRDATKYALTPTKLCQRDLDLSSDSDAEDRNDTMPINAETTDSSDGPREGGNQSSMNISLARSGEKRRGQQSKENGKKKKFGAREVSESVNNLASASREFASVIRPRDKGVMTLSECVQELLSTGLVQSGDERHLFAAWFFRDTENHIAYSAFETPELRFAWVEYCFKRDKESTLAKQSRARRKL